MDVKYKYIHNTQNFPVTANIRDEKGRVTEAIKFMPATSDKWSGKTVTTGYTRITEEQYEGLVKTSRTWQVFGTKKGFLVAHDDVPAELKTPHEAIRDARKALTKSEVQVAKLEAETDSLKAKLFDAEERYKELSSASTDEEKLKPLNDKLAALEAEAAGHEKALSDALAGTAGLIDELAKCKKLDEFKALQEKICKAQEAQDFE